MPLNGENLKRVSNYKEIMNRNELAAAITECMNLQNTFNSVVNPEWKKAGYNWRRAIWVESAELLDHLHWKWWKDVNAAIDHKQALLEVVDIFHFVMSDRLIDGRKGSDLESSYEWARRHTYANTHEKKLKQVEELVVLCLDKQNFEAAFFQVVVALDIDITDILKYYLGKNALNKFRQDNGYKEGTYIKMWMFNGETVEDNKVLENILESATTMLSFDEIYNQLSTIYNEKEATNETE